MRLVFDVLTKNSNEVMAHVECDSKGTSSLLIKERFGTFEEKFPTAALAIRNILEGIIDLFSKEWVDEKDNDSLMFMIESLESEPLDLKIEYIEDDILGRNRYVEVDLEHITPWGSSISLNNNMFLYPINRQHDVQPILGKAMFAKPKEEEEEEETPKPRRPRTNLTFNDVVGMHEVKDKLQDVIRQFKQAEKHKAWNIKPIRGILLHGPSGTGKSYIAEAFANEIDAEFFPLSSADIMSKYLGESGKAIRAKFDEARKHKLSIIYIDEVDSIASKRDGSENNKERNATLNELLVQMASPENENIVMVSATNMLDLLDPAFLRSGRCDFKIEVSLPDFECRKGILEFNSKGRPLAEDVDFEKIAKNMSGMNCADMAQVANEAARLALKEDKDIIEMIDFDRAFEEMICGSKSKTTRLNDKEKDIVAIHETGHLFANEIYKVNKTKKISILPRGTTLGFVLHANEDEEDRFLSSREELMNRIKVNLAGRAAESVFFGDITTGASNDLEKANKIAVDMVTKYAFVDALGLSTFNLNNPMTINIIQVHVDKILQECYNEVIEMIIRNKNKIQEFANVLKHKEEMSSDEINEVLYKETVEVDC